MAGLVGLTLATQLKQEMIQIKILRYMITAVQVLLLVGIVILERLTKSHALVMQHVYFKKAVYMKYLTPVNRYGIALVLIAVFVVLVVLFKRRGLKHFISYACFTGLAVIVLVLPITSLMTYAYLITIILINMLLEYLKFGLKERHL